MSPSLPLTGHISITLLFDEVRHRRSPKLNLWKSVETRVWIETPNLA